MKSKDDSEINLEAGRVSVQLGFYKLLFKLFLKPISDYFIISESLVSFPCLLRLLLYST